MCPGFLWENLVDKHRLEDPVLNAWIVLEWFLKKWVGGMDWIDLFHGREMWRILVNAVMKLRIAQNAEMF